MIEIKFKPAPIKYVAADGKEFYNKIKYKVHENKLTQMRLEWYNKRFSVWGDLMFFLFKIEPKKPYKF